MNDTDLRDRFASAAARLPEVDDDLADVTRRGRRRRTIQRATASVAVAGVVAVTGVLTGAMLGNGAGPTIEQPDVVSSTPPAPPEPDPAPTSDTVALADLGWLATVYGPDGATRYDGHTITRLTDDPVAVAFGLSDGSLVAQAGPGEPIVHLGTGTEEEALGKDVLVEGGAEQSLLRVTQDLEEPQLWFSIRSGQTEEQTQTLWRMGMAGSGTEQLGEIGGNQSGVAELDVSATQVAYSLYCHLQCQIVVARSLQAIGDSEAQELPLNADWLGGLDLSHDGDRLATVNYRFDPEAGSPSGGELVVFDTVTWDEVVRVELPDLTGWTHSVAFTPDGSAVVVGDPAGPGWIVRGVASRDPSMNRLVETGMVTLHGPIASSPETDPDRSLWPELGAEAVARADADGAVERDPWRQQPFGVVARFATEELGWDPPAVTLVDQADGYAVVEASGEGIALRFRLVQPDGSQGWWIVYGARWDGTAGRWADSIALSVSKADGRLEVGAATEEDGQLELRYRDPTVGWSSAPDGERSAQLHADVDTDVAGAVLVIVRSADGAVLDLLFTAIPAGPFAAG